MKLFLLALPLLAAPLVLAGPGRAPTDNGPIRAELGAAYETWGKARTSFDRATLEAMLAPDFFCQIGTQRMARAEFLERISVRQPGAALTRFDASILTLRRDPDGAWVAVITEKLEFDAQTPDGKPSRIYSLWVTRDRFTRKGDAWQVLSSEAVGNESWTGGELPPFDDWKA